MQAVTFDYWNTLVWEEPGLLRARRLAPWAAILEEAGHGVEADRLAAANDREWETWNHHWEAGAAQFQARMAIDRILTEAGVDPPREVRESLVAVYSSAGRAADLHPADGSADCLRSLKAAGVRLGIVCDVGMTPSHVLRQRLDGWGLLELFDHWSFSDEVGAYKPSARIFEHALAGLGRPTPARVAHVGDRLRTDVAGARAMGMVSVRYIGLYDDEDEGYTEADRVIADLRDLPKALGVSRGSAYG
jgi:putative hydrolase of the HAD superfamily